MRILIITLSLFLIWLLAGCSRDLSTGVTPNTALNTETNTTILPNTPVLTQTLRSIPKFSPIPTKTTEPSRTPTPTQVYVQLPELTLGEYILYSTYDPRKEISHLGVLSPSGLFIGYLAEANVISGSLSPNKKLFAFLYSKPLLQPSVFEIDTMQLLQNNFGDVYCASPSWSPDGKQLALYCGELEPYQSEDIYITTLQTGILKRLSLCTDDIHMCLDPAWSPEGTWIAYEIKLGGAGVSDLVGLHLINVDCLDEPITCLNSDKGPYEASWPYAWSPDGHLLAGQWGETIRIFAMDDSGLVEKRDIQVGARIDSIVWSPSGDKLVYTDGNQIYIMSA